MFYTFLKELYHVIFKAPEREVDWGTYNGACRRFQCYWGFENPQNDFSFKWTTESDGQLKFYNITGLSTLYLRITLLAYSESCEKNIKQKLLATMYNVSENEEWN